MEICAAIGVYAATGSAGSPYIHPLVLETLRMMQQPFMRRDKDNNGQSTRPAELEYITGLEKYLEVDVDDPTRIVDGYVNAWWWRQHYDDLELPSYVFVPQEYLEVHRPQVSNSILIQYRFS